MKVYEVTRCGGVGVLVRAKSGVAAIAKWFAAQTDKNLRVHADRAKTYKNEGGSEEAQMPVYHAGRSGLVYCNPIYAVERAVL